MGQPSVENAAEHYEVVVIGAGQSGLAMGYFLSRQKRRFLIVERARSVGSARRDRWDSLTLFTSRPYDSLPGLDFPGDAAGYPNRDAVIGYLEEYARRFELPVKDDAEYIAQEIEAYEQKSLSTFAGDASSTPDARRITARRG